MTMEQFVSLQNKVTQDAVVRQFQIIGEAVKRISPETRSQNSDIPWSEITGMRDKIIHDYFGVDMEIVWLTAKQRLPQLKTVAERLLRLVTPR